MWLMRPVHSSEGQATKKCITSKGMWWWFGGWHFRPNCVQTDWLTLWDSVLKLYIMGCRLTCSFRKKKDKEVLQEQKMARLPFLFCIPFCPSLTRCTFPSLCTASQRTKSPLSQVLGTPGQTNPSPSTSSGREKGKLSKTDLSWMILLSFRQANQVIICFFSQEMLSHL